MGDAPIVRAAISPIIIVRDGPRTQLILRTGGNDGLLRTLTDHLTDDEINAAVRAWERDIETRAASGPYVEPSPRPQYVDPNDPLVAALIHEAADYVVESEMGTMAGMDAAAGCRDALAARLSVVLAATRAASTAWTNGASPVDTDRLFAAMQRMADAIIAADLGINVPAADGAL